MRLLRYFSIILTIAVLTFAFQTQTTFAQNPGEKPQIAKNNAESIDVKAEGKTPSNPFAKPEKKDEGLKNNSIGNYSSPAMLHRVGVQTAQTVPLSLDEAIRTALENNNQIEVARDDVRFQETQLRSLLGIYDPVFSVSPVFSRNSSTGSGASNDFRVDSSFNQQISRGGGNYNVFLNTSQTGQSSRNNTNFNQTSGIASSSSTTYFSNL